MEEPLALPPSSIEKAFGEMFLDHALLSDFIFEKRGIKITLEELQAIARSEGGSDANSDVTHWLQRFLAAIRDEVDELAGSIPWKWWRGHKTDLHNVRVELVDIFHFLVSAAQVSGLSGGDFIRLYYMKRKLNYDRQIVGFREGDNKGIVV